MSTWTPPAATPAMGPTWVPRLPPGDKCDVHPGVKWCGDEPCFVCYPTLEAEGTTDYPESWVPDPKAFIRPAVSLCSVIPNPNSEAECKRPWDGEHTVLGRAICSECYEAVASSPAS